MVEGMGDLTVDSRTPRSSALRGSRTANATGAGLAMSKSEADSQALRDRLIETAVEVIADGGAPRLGKSAGSRLLAW